MQKMTGVNMININDTPVVYKSGSGTLFDNYTVSDGVITITGATTIAWQVRCDPTKSYVFSIKTSYMGGTRLQFRIYYSDTPLDYLLSGIEYDSTNVSNTEDSSTCTVPVGKTYVYAGIYADSRIAGTTISELKLIEA